MSDTNPQLAVLGQVKSTLFTCPPELLKKKELAVYSKMMDPAAKQSVHQTEQQHLSTFRQGIMMKAESGHKEADRVPLYQRNALKKKDYVGLVGSKATIRGSDIVMKTATKIEPSWF